MWCHWQLNIVAVSILPMSEKGVTMGECVFLSVVFVGITSYCGCGSRLLCFWWGAVDIFKPAECVLGCWVLPTGCGLLRWSCCIKVLGNKLYLLYSWVDVKSRSEIVSCGRLVFYIVLSCVFWIQKGKFARLKKR